MGDTFVFRDLLLAAPRLTYQGRETEIAKRYYAYREHLQWEAKVQKFTPGNALSMYFYVRMPLSWSKKKKMGMVMLPCQSVPDLDNYVKAILDALFGDDRKVWLFKYILKLWSYDSLLIIKNINAGDASTMILEAIDLKGRYILDTDTR